LRALGRDRHTILSILDEARKLAAVDETVQVFIPHWDGWTALSTFKPRGLTSVVLPERIAENIQAGESRAPEKVAWSARWRGNFGWICIC
jgi:hypothetical protein